MTTVLLFVRERWSNVGNQFLVTNFQPAQVQDGSVQFKYSTPLFILWIYKNLRFQTFYYGLIFILISAFHFFNLKRKHAHIFANIIQKIFCKHYTPKSDKVSASKFVKLSVNDFIWSLNISEMIDCHTYISTDALQPSSGTTLNLITLMKI